MQLHKFYGRTLQGTLARVRRQLGPDALILETRTIQPGSPAARMNPGARYEICAVREAPAAPMPATPLREPVVPQPAAVRLEPVGVATPRRGVVEDLAELRSQIRDLLDDSQPETRLAEARLDLEEYRALLRLGIASETLAPVFRAWLQWRLATPVQRRYLAAAGGDFGPATAMQGDGLREWLWRGWASGQGLDGEEEDSVALTGRVVALLGATGVGKTTTIAKLASKLRQRGRQNIGILTLDTHRVGAADQMRRFCKLLGVTLHEVVTEDDARVCADWWDRFDWIGIDTPGGMAPGSPAHRLYGSILAQFPDVNSLLLLPAGLHEADGRAQMERARQLGARRLIFSKIDETTRPGGMVNLTMDGSWKIDSVTTGQRVPEDWMAASATTLWSRVLAPEAVCSGVGA